MKKRSKGLGRGLEALLGGEVLDLDSVKPGELRELPLESIQRGRCQPRITMDPAALEDLSNSIRMQGVVQPIVVRPNGEDNTFEIIAGERRWRAAQLAGLSEIPAVVREVRDDAAIAIALIENIQREALNPIEEAGALRRLIDEFKMTHQSAADAVGKSRVAVTNLLRLLDLNPDVRELLEQNRLEMGHARALLGLTDELQSQAARQVVAKALTARETERLVRRLKSEKPRGKVAPPVPDQDVLLLERKVSEKLGAKVDVIQAGAGKGRLVIHYTGLDQLDGILAHIQ